MSMNEKEKFHTLIRCPHCRKVVYIDARKK